MGSIAVVCLGLFPFYILETVMLSTVLKTVEEFGEEGIAKESLLSRIQQSEMVKCSTFEDLNSQFNQALDAGRRFGLLSVKSSLVKLLCNSVAIEEPRSFSAQLLMLNEEFTHELDDEDEVNVSSPLDDSGSALSGQKYRSPRLRPRNLRVTFDERHLARQIGDFQRSEADMVMNLRSTVASDNQSQRSSSKSHRNVSEAIKQRVSLGPIARSLSILVILYLFLRWCNAC
ncbi:uncharacterized protein LOC134288343 [Aedes albopictus]|uniref:Secreted protein n=1 Tax=Aedes albopictus TaxID=7160 RepID=A0ABM1Z7S0_AEDAL